MPNRDVVGYLKLVYSNCSVTISTQQLGDLEACSLKKRSEIRHSEITSEVSFFDFLREARNTCNS